MCIRIEMKIKPRNNNMDEELPGMLLQENANPLSANLSIMTWTLRSISDLLCTRFKI